MLLNILQCVGIICAEYPVVGLRKLYPRASAGEQGARIVWSLVHVDGWFTGAVSPSKMTLPCGFLTAWWLGSKSKSWGREWREQTLVSQVWVMLPFTTWPVTFMCPVGWHLKVPHPHKGRGNRPSWLFSDSIIYHSKSLTSPSHHRSKKEKSKNEQEWEGEVGSVKTTEVTETTEV